MRAVPSLATSRAVVVGVGNPTRADDAVGPHAAALLARLLPDPARDRITVEQSGSGGLRLMELLVGYEHAVVIDAMQTCRHRVGDVVALDIDVLDGSLHSSSVHDMSLPAALDLGRALGLPLPQRVHVLGVEVDDVLTFSEHLTARVSAALPDVVLAAARLLADELHLAGLLSQLTSLIGSLELMPCASGVTSAAAGPAWTARSPHPSTLTSWPPG